MTVTADRPKAKRSHKPKKPYLGRIYLGRDENGKQLFEHVGWYARKKERDKAVEEAKEARRNGGGRGAIPLCDVYVERYIAEYAERNRDSSTEIVKERLARFKADFAGRRLDIPRDELKDWMNGRGDWSHRDPVPKGYRPAVVTLYNHAIDEDDIPLERNPARKLGRRTKSRMSKTPPPTEQEFGRLLDACDALGEDYAPRMRELMLFAAYELMRPSELFALHESKLDLRRMRVMKDARLWKGSIDSPKTGDVEVPLTPPARDTIANRPRNDRRLVFVSKEGKRLSQATLSGYWAQVKARAQLDFSFYHATKHYGVHYMWTDPELHMSPRAIAALAGWKVSTVIEMLETYGHGDVGAAEEVDAAFARAGRRVRHLRVIEGMAA